MLTSQLALQLPERGGDMLLDFVRHLQDHESGEFNPSFQIIQGHSGLFYDRAEAIALEKTVSRLKGELTALRHNHAVDLKSCHSNHDATRKILQHRNNRLDKENKQLQKEIRRLKDELVAAQQTTDKKPFVTVIDGRTTLYVPAQTFRL